MRARRFGSVLLLLCGSVAIVPSCSRVEISLEPFDAGGAAGDGAGGVTSQAGQHAEGGAGAPESPLLGRACETDQECDDGTGLSCLRALSDDVIGAPAHGLCTFDCKSDADCRRFGDGSICGSFFEPPLSEAEAKPGAQRWCLRGCSLGEPSGTSKCHGRADLACRPFAPPGAEACTGSCTDGSTCYRGLCRATACGPRCNGDDDCPQGRGCSAQTGLCEAKAEPFVQFGKPCVAEAAAAPSCGAGVCFTSEGTQVSRQICTESCTLGSICADGAGACVQARLEPYAAGDIGYCAQTCACDGDCLYPGDRCYAWKNPDFARQFGRPGYCQPELGGASLSECAAGGAGSK